MAAPRNAEPVCASLRPWLVSLILLIVIIGLSVFGAGVVAGQMIARSDRPSPAAWGGCW